MKFRYVTKNMFKSIIYEMHFFLKTTYYTFTNDG